MAPDKQGPADIYIYIYIYRERERVSAFNKSLVNITSSSLVRWEQANIRWLNGAVAWVARGKAAGVPSREVS